ncbi:hypothetical protein [Ornithinimicrobium murale]|uniref:hypothetical protein n=1 Tax=Ornithinimicrobium murale TaxID=1050153 RepID=UPI0013B3ED5C|nr:hypothetical protein [Ornithinimicrobium murale]
MLRITLSRRSPVTASVRPSWRERREARQLHTEISRRPQNVRNELLEMAARAR